MKNHKLNPILFVLAFILISSIQINSQTTHNISNLQDLETLTATLGAGDTVILADGVYTSDERIKFSPTTGTSALPITFRSATPGGVKFTNGLQMSIGGDYVIIDGFHWQGGFGASNFIEFRDGSNYANYSKIQNCVIDGLEISPDDKADDGTTSITKHRWVVLYGTYNTVINCSFMNKKSAGALILVELEYNASPDNDITNTRCNEVGHTISNNYFYKYAKIDSSLSNAGDSETIRVGTSEYQNVNSSTTVSNNYFVEADGENEIITNKSKNNKYINNTFRRSRGSLVLRHGSNATVDGNYFLGENVDGTGGIRITDSDHIITNNYIQDCITVADQAKWNNGITFLGGGDNAAVNCNSTSVSNGYQKSENITLSNNSVVNTNAPLFYNTDKGSNDPTGTVSNNLIYFDAANPNITDVLTGDTANSYSNLGKSLTYSGNIFKGTVLGETNAGFAEEIGISTTADGEIFTFSGANGKGADLGAYKPTTDAMVGNGIGACFVNNLGENITNGNCTIEISESLTVSSLPELNAVVASYDVSLNANVSWSATSNNTWISIDINSGTGNETISVTVAENTNTSNRTGSVTFTQNPGGDNIVRTLTVIQKAAERTNLINTGLAGDSVTIHSFSKEEVGNGKNNAAVNTLDKNLISVWAADDGAILPGDNKGDGEFIIYDLGSNHTLDFIQFNTTNKSDAFGFQILVSTTGTTNSDFSKILPTSSDLLLTATSTTDFNEYNLNAEARYVKLVGFGRFNSTGNTRTSVWAAVGEIEFYGNKVLSVNDVKFDKQVLVYPIPAKNNLNIKILNNKIEKIKVFSMRGQLIIEKTIDNSKSDFFIDVSTMASGNYVLNVSNTNGINNSRIIMISH